MSEPTPTFDKDIQKLLADPQYQGHPLQAALSQLWDRYYSLAQRIDRVTRISDAYQSLALEREMNLDEQLEKQLRQFQKLARISDRYQMMMRDLNTALTQASTHDVLTGLPNRRLLVDKVKEETARSHRTHQPFTVAMLDLDDFKAVNDAFGHEAGDLMLVHVAKTLKQHLRESDTCGRWGGEEFLLLLPETDSQAAQVVIERLRLAIGALHVPYEEGVLSLTVSAGLATLDEGGDYSSAVNRADAALMRAKREGRNCWRIAES